MSKYGSTEDCSHGILAKIDINADRTLNIGDLNAWNEMVGEYRNHTYQGVFIVS